MSRATIHLPFKKLGYVEPIELEALDRVALSHPRDASLFVQAVAAAGEPAAQSGGQIYVRPEFAAEWTRRASRFKKGVPARGARMRKLVAEVAAELSIGAAGDSDV